MLVMQDNKPEQAPVDYLLISTPNLPTTNRLRVQLAAAGITTAVSDMGLEVWSGDLDWQCLLESLSLVLSAVERRDTRVATLRKSDDPAHLNHAIFRAKSLERLLVEMREDWFHGILAGNRITMHFQPLVQYPPGKIHGYECLMRGVDSDGRLIPPGRMFEAAETLDRLRLLDEQCRAAALREIIRLRDSDCLFFVNFLPSALADPWQCLENMLNELRAGGVRPEQVVFEVVETDRVYDQRELVCILRSFRKAGFKVALDDVGAGYASLLSLSLLRPDYIKLDGELVRRAAHSALEAKMVADLAETARQHGIITIAEGIETEQELQLVLSSGIPITQGYLHCKPQPEPLDESEVRRVMQRISGTRHQATAA